MKTFKTFLNEMGMDEGWHKWLRPVRQAYDEIKENVGLITQSKRGSTYALDSKYLFNVRDAASSLYSDLVNTEKDLDSLMKKWGSMTGDTNVGTAANLSYYAASYIRQLVEFLEGADGEHHFKGLRSKTSTVATGYGNVMAKDVGSYEDSDHAGLLKELKKLAKGLTQQSVEWSELTQQIKQGALNKYHPRHAFKRQ